MFRTLRFSLLFALVCAGAASCISPPDFSDTPKIKFEKLDVVRIQNQTGIFDSDTIVVYFEDGNGDLGLSDTDIMAPYNEVKDPVTGRNTNPNYFNYYIQPQVKRAGDTQFVDFVNPQPFGFVGEYNSRYPRLDPPNSEKEAPLKGSLRLSIKFGLGNPFLPGDEVRFKVSIKDRALNQSNEITTSSYVVKDF